MAEIKKHNQIYEVIPLKGVGPILLGMSRVESRLAMGLEPKVFKKTAFDVTLTDTYQDNTFQVFFDENDAVEYIELSQGGSVPVMYKGVAIFETKAEKLVEIISKDAPFDPNDSELGYTYMFPLLQLSLWRPVMPEGEDDEEGMYFSTMGIGREGYYS